MSGGFVSSVLSGRKQRQRFYWVRNIVSLLCAVGAFQSIGGVTGAGVAGVVLIGSYFTISPVIAFVACLIEQMYS